MVVLRRKAYAKVNLAFEVLGKREDGYHEVRTLLQTIELWDELEFLQAEDLETRCEGLEIRQEDNLVHRAAKSLQQFSNPRQGARISLWKGIPVSAGLGGGSADAAVTLNALNHFWQLGLSAEVIQNFASGLGMDVPFLLRGGTGLGVGRGDLVTFLPSLVETWLVLLVPPNNHTSKTGALYSLLCEQHWSDGSSVDALANHVKLCEAFSEELMVNTFEQVVERAYPAFSEYRDLLSSVSLGRPHLSGAGPALYSIAGDREMGRHACASLRSRGLAAFLVRTI